MGNSGPFVKLIRSPRGYYVYDVNRNSILKVSKGIYDYLHDGNNKTELSIGDKDYLEKIIEKGYLSTKRVEKIEHPYSWKLPHLLSANREQLILQVTQKCNLSCYYCPYADITENKLQRNHSNVSMNFDIAKRAVDDFFAHSYESERITISFYGGEPLIAFSLIKEIVKYASELFVGKDLLFNITTNGTLITSEIADFLVAHKIRVMFSIDGPKKIHDIDRKRIDGTGSFHDAYNGLKILLDKYDNASEEYISINTVITPRNDIDDICEFYNDPIFNQKKVNIVASFAEDEQLDKKIVTTSQFKEKINYKYFLYFLEYLHIVEGLNNSPLTKNILSDLDEKYSDFKKPVTTLPDVGAPSGPCLPGKRRLFVDVYGNYFPCERVSEISDIMKIGNVYEGIDIEKAKKILNISQMTAKQCRNCWAFLYCSICAKNIDEGGTFSINKKEKKCLGSQDRVLSILRECILIKEARTLYKV